MSKSRCGIILVFFFILGACSKTNPRIEQKEKVIEKNLKTYDALTATTDFQKLDKNKLDEAIERIRKSRQVNFDWKSFWVNSFQTLDPTLIPESTVSNLFTLSRISCEEDPDSSYRILQFIEKGLDQHLKANSSHAGFWFVSFIKTAEDCRLQEGDSFIFRYRALLNNVLKSGLKNVVLKAFEDLKIRLGLTRNPLFVHEMRNLFNGDMSLFNLADNRRPLKETILLAHTFRGIYPYRTNPFLEELIVDTSSDETSLEYFNDLKEALSMLSQIDIPAAKLPLISQSLISLLKARDVKGLQTAEEKLIYFQSVYQSSEILLSLLEKEFLSTNSKPVVLDKVEMILRNLEKSFFQIPYMEDAIVKNGIVPLNLMLDLRHSKKTGLALILESKPVDKISKLGHLLRLFHRMHQNEDTKSQVDIFCEWAGIRKLNSLPTDGLANGCYELVSHEPIVLQKNHFQSGLFSVLRFSGDLTIKAKTADISVIDLSQTKIPEKSNPLYAQNLSPIVFPMLLGFELTEDFLDMKKDKLYFFPYNYVHRDASQGLPHSEAARDGMPGGNLSLKLQSKSLSFLPTFISNGGLPSEALPGNRGGAGVSYTLDMFGIEEWLSSASNGEIYPLEILSVKNLKKVFTQIKKSNENKSIVKIEPGFINYIGVSSRAVFDESLRLSRAEGEFSSPTYLQDLAQGAANQLINEIDNKISLGDPTGKILLLNSSINLSHGSDSAPQIPGRKGVNGEQRYE